MNDRELTPFKPGTLIVIPDGSKRMGTLIHKNTEMNSKLLTRNRIRHSKLREDDEEWFVRPMAEQSIELHVLREGLISIY